MGCDTVGSIKGFVSHQEIAGFIKENYDKNVEDHVIRYVMYPISKCNWKHKINEHSEDKANWYTEHGFIYFKYNYMTENTSIENLVNCRTTRDIYKNAMIDMIIKKVIKVMDLNEYKGKLYNAYTKLQISNKITNVLKPYINKLFKSYELINIGFVKTGPSFGYIYIELSIIPFGSIEELKVVMEV